jgi:hypothetical protein
LYLVLWGTVIFGQRFAIFNYRHPSCRIGWKAHLGSSAERQGHGFERDDAENASRFIELTSWHIANPEVSGFLKTRHS